MKATCEEKSKTMTSRETATATDFEGRATTPTTLFAAFSAPGGNPSEDLEASELSMRGRQEWAQGISTKDSAAIEQNTPKKGFLRPNLDLQLSLRSPKHPSKICRRTKIN